MSFLPRAIIGAAPALFLLVAGAVLIQKYRPDRTPTADDAAVAMQPTPDEVRAKVDEYRRRGCTCPVLYPMSDPYLMIDTFAQS